MFVFKIIVRKTIGKMSHRSFTLTKYIFFVIHNIINSLVSVSHLPYDDCGDLDWITHFVIHLQSCALEVLRTQRNIFSSIQGINKEPSIFLDSSDIFSKKIKDARMIRLNDCQASCQEQGNSN